MSYTLVANRKDMPHDNWAGTFYCTLTFSASSNTYATGGVTIDLTTMTPAGGILPPINELVQLVASSDSGYTPYWVKGTTLANGKLKLFTSGTTELANATAINNLVFVVQITWAKNAGLTL